MKINIARAKSILERVAKARMDGASTPALILKGSPGCGKSSIVRQVADEMHGGFVDIRLAQMERVDVSGLPSVRDGQTRWNVPEFWPTSGTGIILLDEITSAPPDVQVAAYSLVLDRRIPNSGYKIPDGWSVVAAGNLATDKAVVKAMSSALANRFLHIEVETDPNVWGDWAVGAGLNPSVTGFIKFRPGLLFHMEKENLTSGFPTPRSWEGVSNMLALNLPDEELTPVVYGLVGEGAGIEFLAFHKMARNMVDVEVMLDDPTVEVVVPSKPDEEAAFLAAVVYQLWAKPEKKTARVAGMFRVMEKLGPDFTQVLIMQAMLGSPQVPVPEALKEIKACPAYEPFVTKHKAAFKRMRSI